MRGPTIVLLMIFLTGGARAVQSDEDTPTPLLELRAGLVQDDRAYFHLTPEAVLVYFRAALLKRLPVEALERRDRSPLRLSRLESLSPEIQPPLVVLEGAPEDDLESATETRMRLEDVPSTFALALKDGTVVLVTADAAERRSLRSMIGSARTETRHPPILLQMRNEHDARQFYWHLRTDSAIIY